MDQESNQTRNQMLGAKIVKNLQPATWKLIIQTQRRGSEEALELIPEGNS